MYDEQADGDLEPVNLVGESVQAALNARLRRTTRLTFFDDESGEEDMQTEPDDFNLVTGMVDRKVGWNSPRLTSSPRPGWAWYPREGHSA